MNDHRDPALRALEFLRDQHGPELPDPELEARLRARFPARRARTWRLAAAGVALAGLCGATFAASGGLAWLRSWWYEVDIDGQTETGVVDGEGARTFLVETDDGGTASVRIVRDRVGPDATRTRIAIDREGPGRVERERAEDVIGTIEPRRLSASVLAGADPFYVGGDDSGARFELYVQRTAGGGSRLLLWRPGVDATQVEEVARLPFVLLGDGAEVEIGERPDGSLSLSFEDGREGAFQFVLSTENTITPEASELSTEDGRIRVRVENAPLHEEPDGSASDSR